MVRASVKRRSISYRLPARRPSPSLRDPDALFADGGVTQNVRAVDEYFTRDQAVIVDTAGSGVFRPGVDDALEASVFINKPGILFGGNVVAHDYSGIVDARQYGPVFRIRVIDGRELSVLPGEPVVHHTA